MNTSLHRLDQVYPPHNKELSLRQYGKDYNNLYAMSISQPQQYWDEIAKTFHWNQPWTSILSYNFYRSKGPIQVEWFIGGKTNICYNMLDRHLPSDKIAYHWEGNDIGETDTITYDELYTEVIQLCGVLRSKYGVTKGTIVTVYLPVILFGPTILLALSRIGAIANVVFGGFSAQSLASRMLDCNSSLVITVEGVFRGDKPIKLKDIVDEAIHIIAKESTHNIHTLIYKRHSSEGVPVRHNLDCWYQDIRNDYQPDHTIEWVDSEDPLFILYTSGTTGKPKGLVHTTGGYMVYTATTFKHTFNYQPDDIYFCTADIGWITGHSYMVYGPLLNHATSVLYEGIPLHPTPSRWWYIIDKYNVSQFYTAPTAIRALMRQGDHWVIGQSDRTSLRILGSVGEPIDQSAWQWYYEIIGNKKVDIVDTWWQTETGGHMITPIPGITYLKPGSASFPFFSINPVIIDPISTNSNPIHIAKSLEQSISGYLCIQYPWPGIARTIYKDHSRYEETYFNYDGLYFSGDGCTVDKEGYYWLTGRVDDVINVSAHRICTSEVEAAINTHPLVIESAVVPINHDIKGQALYAYVICEEQPNDACIKSIKQQVRDVIGPIATPDYIHITGDLPKTRSGKIVRRILRKIANKDIDSLGDLSTISNLSVIDSLIQSIK